MSNQEENTNELAKNDDPTRRKRRERRRKSEPETAEENKEQNEPQPNPRRPRRKTQKANKGDENPDKIDASNMNKFSQPIGLIAHLEDLQDDIEIRTLDEDELEFNNLNVLGARQKMAANTIAGNTIYIEGNRRFREENHDKFLQDRTKENELNQQTMLKMSLGQYEASENELLKGSIGLQMRYRVVGTYLHGIFAGLLIMHSIFLFLPDSLPNDANSRLNFINYYLALQQPFSIFCYLCFIVVSISLWDRLNVGESERGSCNLQQSGLLVSILLMFIGFVINNCLYNYNSAFTNYKLNKTNPSYANVVSNEYSIWRILYTVVCALVSLGWFIVAMVPSYDAMVNQMQYDLHQHNNTNTTAPAPARHKLTNGHTNQAFS